MRGVVPLGRVAGIPVAAHWTVLVVVVLLGQVLALSVLPTLAPGQPPWAYWSAGTVGAVALIGALLAHELAHAVVARRTGVGVRRITLWLLGGVSELDGRPAEPATEVRVALAGPATSLALGVVLGALAGAADVAGASQLVVATLSWLATMNVVLGVFNLLPGTPLDGGRVLHGLLWRRTGDPAKATRITSNAGRFLGALLAGVGVLMAVAGRFDGLWLVLVGWFLAGAAAFEGRTGTALDRLGGLRAGDVMSAPGHTVPGWWTVEAFAERLLHPSPATAPQAHHRLFPVVELDGRLAGVVSIGDLSRCPAGDRGAVTVRALARPLPEELVLAADTPLERVLAVVGRGGMAVVTDGARVLGVITASDVARILELAAFVPEEGPHRTPR